MSARHQQTVATLLEALPYIRRFWGATLVVACGGAALASSRLREQLAEDIVLLRLVGMKPVVVHGGYVTLVRRGIRPQASRGAGLLGDAAAGEAMQEPPCGAVCAANAEIVDLIRRYGGAAVGISGRDPCLLRVLSPKRGSCAAEEERPGGSGRVAVAVDELQPLVERGIPVLAGLGQTGTGEIALVGADTVAGEAAAVLGAEKVVFLTDEEGIYEDQGADVSLVTECDLNYLGALQAAGRITGEMAVIVGAVRRALEAGVASAHIVDGRVQHAVLLEILTDAGCGTKVTP